MAAHAVATTSRTARPKGFNRAGTLIRNLLDRTSDAICPGLAGFRPFADVDHDLVEWDYGEYEGRTTAQIQAERPDWELFRDGCPGGESAVQVGARADRAVNRVRSVDGDVLIFSSGHFLRVLAARWLALEPGGGRNFFLSTASLSELSYEHDLTEPVIRLWNDTRHVGT